MDLSEAFDTINPELLIAKLHPYGFSTEAHKVLLSYVQERWQRVKINTTFSSSTRLLQGVPKDQFLVPCCLKFTAMIYFLQETKLIFITLQMTQLHTFVIQN